MSEREKVRERERERKSYECLYSKSRILRTSQQELLKGLLLPTLKDTRYRTIYRKLSCIYTI